ncbi:MAG: hypothetical protein J6U86_05440, partial [Clostridia bacterium]|nr:hypothetical protein [Clostridia bacterium]
MTKKLKLFKGIFLSFMSVLSLAMALHNFVCIEETYLYNPNLSQPISYKFYGANYSIYGDIQHSIADVGNNVDKLSEHVTWMGEEIFSSMLSGFAFVFLLVFFVCLYLAIK